MSALVQESNVSTIADLSLDDALDVRAGIITFLDENAPKIMEARKELARVESLIQLRMEETGARRFERGGFRGWFEKVKSRSATVPEPAALRAELLTMSEIPRAEIDAALPCVEQPVVTAKVALVRKLAAYSNYAASRIEAYIKEGAKTEALVIEPVIETKNVTGSATEALT